MKLLADENISGDVVATLRQRGHDVTWIRTDVPGAPDANVLACAVAEDRLLLTFDKDFGELVFARGLRPPGGIILLRLTSPSPGRLAERVAAVLESRSDWIGHFSTVDDAQVRQVALPRSSS